VHYGIAIELRADCQKCGQPVHVNALVEEVQCKGCHAPLRLSWERWKGLLEDAFDEVPDYEIGRGGRSQSFSGEGNTNLLYVHFDPYCFDCKEDFDMSEVAAAGKDEVECKKCHKHWHVRPLPAELESQFPGVELLLAEDETLLPGGDAHAGEAPNGGKPIVFQCPSCSGALRVDGSDRVIDCEFCNSSVYLPDDLWFRLHPRDTVRRWFLWWRSDRKRDPARFPVEDEDDETVPPPALEPLSASESSDDLIELASLMPASSEPESPSDVSISPAPLIPEARTALAPTSTARPAHRSGAPVVALTIGIAIAALVAGALLLLI
jgi:hypothetical protein